MSEKSGSSLGKLALWALALGGVGYLVYRVVGIKKMVSEAKFYPNFDGTPSIKGGELVVPFLIEIQNPTNGTLTIGISRLEGLFDGKSICSFDIPTNNQTTIKPNGWSTLKGYKIRLPLNNILQAISANVYDVVNKNLTSLLDKLVLRFDAIVGGALTVSIEYSFKNRATNGLGLVSTQKRKILPLSDYAAFIPSRDELLRTDQFVNIAAATTDTVQFMHQVVESTLSDTRKLAEHLKRDSLKETIQSVYDFVYSHIKYELDSVAAEQVRRPLRTLYDQKGDCDCYSTLIASILTNLGIPFKFRIAAFEGRDYYQHVYVIVPHSGGYYVCDPVMDRCFAEKKPSKYKDL